MSGMDQGMRSAIYSGSYCYGRSPW